MYSCKKGRIPAKFLVADVNGDGKDDFIIKWRKASGTTSVFVHLGSASGFTEAVATTTSLAFFME